MVSCLLSLISCLPRRDLNLPPTQSLESPRIVSYNNLPFYEKWRKSQVTILNPTWYRLRVYDKKLFFISYEYSTGTGRLEVLNAGNGQLLWKTEPLRDTAKSVLVVDQNRAYLAFTKEIIAYDLLTGEVVWKIPSPGDRTSYKLEILGNTLVVSSQEDVSLDGSEEQVVRIYDSQTGLLTDTQRSLITSKNSSLLLKTLNYEYWTDTETLWAINTEGKGEQWRVMLDNRVVYEPLFGDSIFIFASGIFSDIVAIDNISGRQIWRYEDKIVSDLAMKDGIVYAIKADATIVAIDSKTGKVVGHINVAPQATETGSRSLAFLIAVYEDLLFAYYGDSQEIIAFSR